MEREKLNAILESHQRWLDGEGGQQADLSGADLTGVYLWRVNLSGAKLSGANLTDADMREVILRGADLTGAKLERADMRKADLTGAKLVGADMRAVTLQNAILRDANLTGATLQWSVLHGAVLDGANLCRADLHGTNLRDVDLDKAILHETHLDDNILSLQREFVRQCPPLRTGGRIVYRTARSIHVGSTEYKPGHTYVAPVLSADLSTACHPGIYAGSYEWMRTVYPTARLVRCYVRDGDWFIVSNGAIRCKRIRVLSYVDDVHGDQQ